MYIIIFVQIYFNEIFIETFFFVILYSVYKKKIDLKRIFVSNVIFWNFPLKIVKYLSIFDKI
jgi:hypothetical protein